MVLQESEFLKKITKLKKQNFWELAIYANLWGIYANEPNLYKNEHIQWKKKCCKNGVFCDSFFCVTRVASSIIAGLCSRLIVQIDS